MLARLAGRGCIIWCRRGVRRRGGSGRCCRRCRWCCLGAARRGCRARRTGGPLALMFVLLTGWRSIRRHRRFWRRRRGCRDGRSRGRGTRRCRGRRRRGSDMGRRRGGRRRTRRRRCCRRRGRYGLGRGMRGCGGGRRRMRRRCGFGRRALRLSFGGLFGLSVGTELAGRRLRHDDRRGLCMGWRAHEVHRRQSRSGKQHETKVCHDDVNPRKGSEQ